jgi:hypothetical protein
MQPARKLAVEKQGRGTSLAERQAAMRAKAGKTLRIVRANQEKARGSLRIRLAESSTLGLGGPAMFGM